MYEFSRTENHIFTQYEHVSHRSDKASVESARTKFRDEIMGRRDSLHADQYKQGTPARHQPTAVRSGQSRHSQSGSHSEGTYKGPSY